MRHQSQASTIATGFMRQAAILVTTLNLAAALVVLGWAIYVARF
jgi:hypothetical protein